MVVSAGKVADLQESGHALKFGRIRHIYSAYVVPPIEEGLINNGMKSGSTKIQCYIVE